MSSKIYSERLIEISNFSLKRELKKNILAKRYDMNTNESKNRNDFRIKNFSYSLKKIGENGLTT